MPNAQTLATYSSVFVYFMNVVDSEVSPNNSKRLLYDSTKIAPPPCTQGIPAVLEGKDTKKKEKGKAKSEEFLKIEGNIMNLPRGLMCFYRII